MAPYGAYAETRRRRAVGGTPEFRHATAESWRGEQPVLVENVPAWVCRYCGEQYFDAATCRSLEALR